MLIFKYILIITLLFIFLPDVAFSGGNDFAPWTFSSKTAEISGGKPQTAFHSPLAEVMVTGIHFFREFISEVDGDRCLMHPSCSSYSLQSFEKHGFFMGYLLTVDRLIHENNEMDRASIIKVEGRPRYFDPLENNDFWWQPRSY